VEDIECIFCRKPSDNVVIEENGYTGKKCPECGLIYVSPRPTILEIYDLYQSGESVTYFADCQDVFGTSSKRMVARHHVGMIKRILQRGSILEIGSGTGEFLDEARKEGFDVCGIEINPRLSRFISEELSIPCENGPLNSFTFGGKKFNMIYHCDVLSHLHDPFSEFMQMNAKLTPAGFIVFETGNLGDVDPRYYRWFSGFQYPDHLFFYSVRNILDLLCRTGFQPLRIHSFGMLPELFLWKVASALLGPLAGQNALKRISALGCVRYLVRYRLGSLLHAGRRMPQTLVVVGRKKVHLDARSKGGTEGIGVDDERSDAVERCSVVSSGNKNLVAVAPKNNQEMTNKTASDDLLR
jgi:SAM-dependent methyltransferase